VDHLDEFGEIRLGPSIRWFDGLAERERWLLREDSVPTREEVAAP